MTRESVIIPALLLAIGLCFAGTSARAQSPELDMKTAIQIAISNNYSLKADSMNIIAAGYQKKVAQADWLPQVNFSNKMEYNVSIASQMVPGSMVGQPSKESVPVQFGTRYNMGTGVEVTQAIVRKTSRLHVYAAELNTHIARTKHTLSREELVYNVASSFYALQTTAEEVRLTASDYGNLQEVVALAKAQYENGVLKRIEYESLQINAANKLAKLNQLKSAQAEQLSYFKYLLGLPDEEPVVIKEEIRGLAETTSMLAFDLGARQDIHLSMQQIQAKDIELKSIRAEKAPTVSSYFRFNYQSQFNNISDGFKSDYMFNASVIGITTSIPLFDGYRRKSRTQVAQSELKQLQYRSEQQKQLAASEWSSARETLQRDRKNYAITQQNLQLAEKVFLSRKALYAEGVTSLVELLDAERELSQSRNLQIDALINVQSSVLKMHKATGTLLTDFINYL